MSLQRCSSDNQALTPSRVSYPFPAFVPITVGIAASLAISKVLSLTGPLNTIAIAPSAASASLANLAGPTSSEIVPTI